MLGFGLKISLSIDRVTRNQGRRFHSQEVDLNEGPTEQSRLELPSELPLKCCGFNEYHLWRVAEFG